MKKLFTVLPILCLFYCCSNHDYDLPRCQTDDAAQDLRWLKDIIDDREANPTEDMKYCYIEQASLTGKNVFMLSDCNPLFNKVVFVRDCEGRILKSEDGKEVYANTAPLKNRKIIWKPVDFACNL